MPQGSCGHGVIHPMLRARTTDSGLVISQGVPASLVPASLVSRGKSGIEDRFGGSWDTFACFQGLVKA